MDKKEENWKEKLSEEEYKVLRKGGTEKPFSGKYVNHNEEGQYTCKACGNMLFESDSKYDSQTPGLLGWPSFSEVIESDAIETRQDNSFGMKRTEVLCAQCNSHLGHVFHDSESETGKHYCINSIALNFKKNKEESS